MKRPRTRGLRDYLSRSRPAAPTRAARSPRMWTVPLDHATFCQNGKFTARQPQFVAEDFYVVLADQRGASGDPPGRAVIDRRLAGVDEAATELWVLDLLPEASVMQMAVVKEILRRANRANKAPWFEITDDLPQHQGWPPVE
jgi:hypothetical protein